MKKEKWRGEKEGRKRTKGERDMEKKEKEN